MLWQNRRALQTALDPLARAAGVANSKVRQYELLVASYLQRYCVKNDTIGFFGPVHYAEFGDEARLVPGADVVGRRRVYFEHWALAALAARLAEDPEVLRDIPPRRPPTLTLDGTTVDFGIGGRASLPAGFAKLLAACDGTRTARELARAFAQDGYFDDEDDVYAHLEALVDKKLVRWAIDLPTHGVYPERALREILDRVSGEPGVRCRQALDELEQCRAAVVAAAGNVAALEQAFQAMEDTFTRLTGADSTRLGGQTYAGRTMVYEDTQRDLDAQISTRLLAQIGPALRLLLHSARWCTAEIARRTRPAIDRIYDELVTDTGNATVAYAAFFARVQAVLPLGGQTQLIDEVRAELHQKWLAILQPDVETRAIARSSAELAGAVDAAFAAAGPGWPAARFQCPDLMIAARSFAEIGTSAARPVLGELHVGHNTLVSALFVKEAANEAAIRQAYTADLGHPTFEQVIPTDRKFRANGQAIALDLHLVETGNTPAWWPPEEREASELRRIRAAELVVERGTEGLRIRTRDGRISCDVIAFYDEIFVEVGSMFSLLPPHPHTPRITIDELVVARERWRVTAADITWATLDRGPQQFAQARAWASALGMPRFIFVKIPEETKPFYVDFASPTYVEIFAKFVRKASVVTMSEMLPTLDETWLRDSQGDTYTCELRIAAVDPVAWRAPTGYDS